jgi:hypothetical protein
MTTIEEVVKQQQEVIEQYRVVLDCHKSSKEKLYQFLETIVETLEINSPDATALAIKHLTILVKERNND